MKTIAGVFATVGLLGLTGCAVVGAMAENYRRETTRTIAPEYTGLDGKTFAVLVHADRAIQGDHPVLIEYLSERITDRLSNPENVPAAAGVVPPAEVLRYCYDHPSWHLKTREEVGKALAGVQRLVVVEVYEYRLNDPGNRYVWDGLAAGTISVFHLDGPTPEMAAMEKTITVKFPDEMGQGPEQLSTALVNTGLAKRFVDRLTWLFYTHEEDYYPKY